jgi:hypothetical protein
MNTKTEQTVNTSLVTIKTRSNYRRRLLARKLLARSQRFRQRFSVTAGVAVGLVALLVAFE